MRMLKQVLYFLSIILPIVDSVRGAVVGVKKGLADVHKHPQADTSLSELEALDELQAMKEKYNKPEVEK